MNSRRLMNQGISGTYTFIKRLNKSSLEIESLPVFMPVVARYEYNEGNLVAGSNVSASLLMRELPLR